MANSLPTCNEFAQTGANFPQLMTMEYNIPPFLVGHPEPRAAWTDLLNASIALEKAIQTAFRVKYGIVTNMTPTALKEYVSKKIIDAQHQIYYAWMYLCIASGKMTNGNINVIINDANIVLSAMSKMVTQAQNLPEDVHTIFTFTAANVYGFQGVIGNLSGMVLAFFHHHSMTPLFHETKGNGNPNMPESTQPKELRATYNNSEFPEGKVHSIPHKGHHKGHKEKVSGDRHKREPRINF